MALRVKTAPQKEPLTAAEALELVRMTDPNTEESAHLNGLIKAAREFAEEYLGRALIDQTLVLTLDSFPVSRFGEIRLLRPPVQSVTSVKYIDVDGVQQTLAAAKYRLDKDEEPARLTPAFNESWPTTRKITSAVEIEYVAGYGADETKVPEQIRSGMRLKIVAEWEREAPPMAAIRASLNPYRVLWRTHA